jgi:hypothetical protein
LFLRVDSKSSRLELIASYDLRIWSVYCLVSSIICSLDFLKASSFFCSGEFLLRYFFLILSRAKSSLDVKVLPKLDPVFLSRGDSV